MRNRLAGALTALVTPFTKTGAVDAPALKRLVEAQVQGGIDGLVACGTTAETATLSQDEQALVVRTVKEAAGGRLPLVVGSGSNSTQATIEQTRRAEEWGADYALVVCPYYNKPTQEGIYRHFMAVREACDLPVIAYNVPGRTVADMLPATVARLIDAGAIAGIKEATANMVRATEIWAAAEGKDFSLLSGDDFTILPFVALGGHGVVSVVSNICPHDTSELVKRSREDVATARALNARIVELSTALFLESNPTPVKWILARAGWCENVLRLPLVEASAALEPRLVEAVNRYRGAEANAPIDGFMS